MINRATVAVEAVLNRYIGQSSAAQDLLVALDGKSLAVRVEGLGLVVCLDAEAGRLSMRAGEAAPEHPPAATLAAPPFTLLRLLNASSADDLRASGADLSGDAETAEAFARLLSLARPELEEELSRLVGDVLAHEIGDTLRRTTAWADRAVAALTMNTSEFLQEEARQLPARPEVEAFAIEVERLRDDVDRAAVRVDRVLDATDL